MASRLTHIKDWESVAHASGYSPGAVATCCRVSVRQLERYFLEKRGKAPRLWLREVRMRRAATLLDGGTTVKETAITLGYRDAAHFTHDFKKHFGVAPSRYVLVIQMSPTENVAFRQVMSRLDKSNSFQVIPTVVE